MWDAEQVAPFPFLDKQKQTPRNDRAHWSRSG
ncbi:Uncharacterised protein [Vibrio cholerae]|nr:Uncharacterised protein [Vibrio cholerae]CSC23787.1 Uncharacterised protein [Vibrio cholerae]